MVLRLLYKYHQDCDKYDGLGFLWRTLVTLLACYRSNKPGQDSQIELIRVFVGDSVPIEEGKGERELNAAGKFPGSLNCPKDRSGKIR